MEQNAQENKSNFLAEMLMQTQSDFTKGMFFASASAIGLLVCLMAFTPILSSAILVLFNISILSFLVCIAVCVYSYRRNADYIVVLGKRPNATDPVLGLLDKVSLVSFLVGLVLLVLTGVLIACQNMQLHMMLR